MGKPFLDTSVILCKFHPADPLKHEAEKLMKVEYLISPLVHEELERIKERRGKIYTSILYKLHELKDNPNSKLTFGDIHKNCFKANYGKNKNDILHLDSIFDYTLQQAGTNKSENLNVDLLEKFAIKLDDIFTEIKFGILTLMRFLSDPFNYEKIVVKKNISKKFNKVHKIFKKLPDYSSNKNDIEILIHGIEYSSYTKTQLDIISNDRYFLRIAPKVNEFALKIFRKIFFKIYSLSTNTLN
jgi:hypothetical protein